MTKANEPTIIRKPHITMSSREIAELTGSSHDNVLKTVRGLIRRGIVFGNETPYMHPQNGQIYKEFLLNYRDTMVVASGYSPELRAKIIDRWMELEGTVQRPTPRLRRPSVLRTFKTAIEIGKLAGLEDNMLALHAGCYCKAKCGENPLELMEVKTLPALENERTLSPTEIGEKLGLSAQRVNEMLCHLGLQHHTYDKRRHRIYHLTGLGKEYGRLEDASRAHSDGSVTVLRWYPRVIDQLEKHLQAQRYPRLEQGLPVVEVVA